MVLLIVVIAMRSMGISRFPIVAMAHDALPVLLSVAWVIGLIAALTGRWALFGFSIVLVVVQLQMVIPRTRANPVPSWAASDPSVSIVCANVFVDNETPGLFAEMLIETDPDIIVIVERNPAFLAAFEAAGGAQKYPFSVDDPDDSSDYAVAIRSKIELREGSGAIDTGNINVARAVVLCGEVPLNILGGC